VLNDLLVISLVPGQEGKASAAQSISQGEMSAQRSCYVPAIAHYKAWPLFG
jgi:hypothetical protein